MMNCMCRKPKIIHCKVILLDEQELIHEIEDTANGQALLEVVFRNLNLLETAYFGLRYLDPTGQTHWLDPVKAINRQIKGPDPQTLYFGVKFYAADPCKLVEEITRYQFFLQVKQDILQERLLVSFELVAELGAYIVQSELGDYDPRRHSKGYVSEFRFLPNQSIELESRISDLHKTLIGQLPSLAELNYLEKVKWLEMYGVDLHPVLGEDNIEYFLGLTPSGIIVLRNKTTVGNYYWPRITKIYFKGRYFMLRVTDKNNDESTYGFETPSKSGCKHLWKCCVEHHAFFRLVQVTPTSPDIFALGSRFRYSGRTEKQAVRDAQMKTRTPPAFSRTPSRRYQRRHIEGHVEPPEETYKTQYGVQEKKYISVPQPAQNFEGGDQNKPSGAYDATKRADSPRSIKSAPWSQPHSKGLYNNNTMSVSPRSVRSAGPRYRSSSLDSQSSHESRTKRRHRNGRLNSDNESELSKSSSRSYRKHRRRRSRGRRHEVDSEPDYPNNSKQNAKSDLNTPITTTDTTTTTTTATMTTTIDRRSSKDSSQMNSTSNTLRSRRSEGGRSAGDYGTQKRKHRKHRSRSRSPADPSKSWLSNELKKHLEFDLIDTSGMSESQLREIPYTVVQTNNSNSNNHKNNQSNGRQLKPKIHQPWKNSELKNNTPPPPYSPYIMQAQRHNAVNNSYVTNHDHYAGCSGGHNNPDAMLPRIFQSLDVSDMPHSYNNFNHNSGGLGYGNSLIDRRLENNLRISHEHTDSGLGTEQDCIYNSERCVSDRKEHPNEGTRQKNHFMVNNISSNIHHQDYFPVPISATIEDRCTKKKSNDEINRDAENNSSSSNNSKSSTSGNSNNKKNAGCISEMSTEL